MTIYRNLDVPQQGMPDNPQECVGEMTSFKGNRTRIASSTNKVTGPKLLSQQGVMQERIWMPPAHSLCSATNSKECFV